MTSKPVRFNVGGTRYEVSRSLLEMYPHTMLARSASELWHADPDAEIFLERDGERFKYVLDFCRDQRVFLPFTIPAEALLADLDYYGFEKEAVDQCKMERSLLTLAGTMVETQILASKEMYSWKAQINVLLVEPACLIVAMEAASLYFNTGRSRYKPDASDSRGYMALRAIDTNKRALELCNLHLGKVGQQHSGPSQYDYCDVILKK